MNSAEMPSSRTDARTAASRANGMLSRGPITESGKRVSAMNAISTGIDARCVVMPDEALSDHQREVDIWTETFRPGTAGEARIVTAISDLFVRLGRVDREEERQREASVEIELRKTPAFKKLSQLSDALAAVSALADTAENIKTTVPYEHLGQIRPAMQRTLELVEDADAPLVLVVALRDAMNGMSVAALLDVGPEEFSEVAVAARDVEAWLAAAGATERAAVHDARTALLTNPTLEDGDVTRRLGRYRDRLHRELDAYLDLLEKVRALASAAPDPAGSFIRVVMRVVDPPNLAQR